MSLLQKMPLSLAALGIVFAITYGIGAGFTLLLRIEE
ncbi:MAG: hypothetical protein ACI8TL_001806 [Natronomonas sp.]|jgi:hypothetical protein